MMGLGRMRNARVLDVGCGFGWQAMLIALLGSNDVVAIDIRETMTDVVQLRTEAMRDILEYAGGSITPLLGDICSLNEKIDPESFDAIFCNQTVEHIRDLPAFFAAAARARRPGGRMVIANDNNALDPQQSSVRHAFRQFPLRPLNGVRLRPLNEKLFAKRSVFVIVSSDCKEFLPLSGECCCFDGAAG